ncbi:MAG: CAP domain-containing protein [Gemmataceae bacterium]|nr:CAP domain-containing protein [Gemmataceae bacterium]
MRWRVSSLLLLSLACIGLAGAGAAGPQQDGALTDPEKHFLELTNSERRKHKLPPLKVSPVLCKVARAHAQNMAKNQKLTHVLDGQNQFQRIKGAGYRYRYAGENVARGNVPPEETFQSLMESKGHRENILAERYTEVGIGLARDAEGKLTYYTQVFAAPRPPPTEDNP